MPDELILPIPTVPKEILEAVNTNKLAVFIGAGVSRIMGCLGWDQLAGKLVERCSSIKLRDGSPNLNYRAIEILSQYTDHKKAITICHEIMRENECENDFFDVIEKSFVIDKKHSQYRDIYNHIYGLRGLFITTNADKHFDQLFNQERIVYKEQEFHHSNIDRTKLYHIHGSIQDPDSLVFTTPRYIDRYRNDDFGHFLERIFDQYVVLFVGYGMSEFELLDFIITKYGTDGEKELKHFILLPFYTGEERRLEFETYYHKKMGVSVIPYQKDQNGYNQLYKVIKDWNSRINQTSQSLYDTYKEIENIVEDYGTRPS
ncbi:SIR2 family protein [Chloroflexota bacterium]